VSRGAGRDVSENRTGFFKHEEQLRHKNNTNVLVKFSKIRLSLLMLADAKFLIMFQKLTVNDKQHLFFQEQDLLRLTWLTCLYDVNIKHIRKVTS